MGVSLPQTQVAAQASSWWWWKEQMRRQSEQYEQRRTSQTVSLIRPRLSAESKVRLVVWLLMIRSRMRRLSELVIHNIQNNMALGFAIRRPHSPIDRVLRVWMENVVVNSGEQGDDDDTLVLLRMFIELLLREARNETDYRSIFIFISERINTHITRLLLDSDPVLVGEMVFADVSAMEEDGLTVRIV